MKFYSILSFMLIFVSCSLPPKKRKTNLVKISLYDNIDADLDEFMTHTPINLTISCGESLKTIIREDNTNTNYFEFEDSLFNSADKECTSIRMINALNEVTNGTFVNPSDGKMYNILHHPSKQGEELKAWFSKEEEYPVYLNIPESFNKFDKLIITCAGITVQQKFDSISENTVMVRFPPVAFEHPDTNCTSIKIENSTESKIGSFIRPEDTQNQISSEVFDRPSTSIVGWWE